MFIDRFPSKKTILFWLYVQDVVVDCSVKNVLWELTIFTEVQMNVMDETRSLEYNVESRNNTIVKELFVFLCVVIYDEFLDIKWYTESWKFHGAPILWTTAAYGSKWWRRLTVDWEIDVTDWRMLGCKRRVKLFLKVPGFTMHTLAEEC